MKMGDKIRLARNQLRWTTTTLANKAGLAQSYISAIENNGKSPSTKAIMRIAAVLNLSVEYLLRNDVDCLAEIGTTAVDAEKYLAYIPAIDQAIAASLTPEELMATLELIIKIKALNPKLPPAEDRKRDSEA